MEFDWDEAKRRANLAKHGLDFADAAAIDWRRTVLVDLQTVDGEEREVHLAVLRTRVVVVVIVIRDRRTRIISMRGATRHEARVYFEHL